MRRARQHAVFARDPAAAGAAQPHRHPAFDARGTEDPRIAELGEHAALGHPQLAELPTTAANTSSHELAQEWEAIGALVMLVTNTGDATEDFFLTVDDQNAVGAVTPSTCVGMASTAACRAGRSLSFFSSFGLPS